MKAVLTALILITGCAPEPVVLEAPGIRVDIEPEPFRYTVRDGSGKVVLSSSDAMGAAAWTSGQLAWGNRGALGVPGHYQVDAIFDPWRQTTRATSLVQLSATELDAELDAGGERVVRARFRLRDSTLRVELEAPGDAPPRAWSVAFRAPADEAYLGFGERFNRTDQRGLNVYSWQEEGGFGSGENTPKGPMNPWPNGEVMTYYPVPFFLSTVGYGFWLDSTWRNEFRLGTDSPNTWRVWDSGPTTAYEIYVAIPNDPRPWPQHVIDSFTKTTGRPMLPPPWSFGPRRRISRQYMQLGVPEIKAMRDLDLALTVVDDALHFLPAGSDVGDEAVLSQWTADAKKLGYRVCGYYNAYIASQASALSLLRDEALSKRLLLENPDGTPSEIWLISGGALNLFTFDVTNPAANALFTAQFQRAFNLGYSCWMYDFGEYVQPTDRAKNGMTGEQLHNLFPVLYDKAAFDSLEAGPHKGDWFFFARSGYTGSQKYTPMVWGGDAEASFDDALGLPSVVRAATNLGLSGVAHWGSDIGGFKCISGGKKAADGEMLTRWIEAGAMGSDMHDEDACPGAKDMGFKASIWNSPDAMAAWKTYARLHTRMFPYAYTLAHEATRTGAPTMRHPFFEHPSPEYARVDDTYFFGPALLVAPVVRRGARTRDIVLPKDTTWVDWTAPTPARVDGPGTVTVDAPLARLPLFLRDGHLVPMLDATIDTLTDETDPDVVGPSDVADVYDVVGLVSARSKGAQFTVYDGSRFQVAYSGAAAAPAGGTLEDLGGGLRRVRVTVAAGAAPVVAGGLTLTADSKRRTRWDLYVAE